MTYYVRLSVWPCVTSSHTQFDSKIRIWLLLSHHMNVTKKHIRNYTRRQLNSRSFSRMRPYSYALLVLSNLPRAAVTQHTP